jgi:hypothetical protein
MTAKPAVLRAISPQAVLRHAIREALELGARFRISGADVLVDNFSALPPRVRDSLRAHTGYLWDLINNGQDGEPLRLLEAGYGLSSFKRGPNLGLLFGRLYRTLPSTGGQLGSTLKHRQSPNLRSPVRARASTRTAAVQIDNQQRMITPTQPGLIRIAPTSCLHRSLPAGRSALCSAVTLLIFCSIRTGFAGNGLLRTI